MPTEEGTIDGVYDGDLCVGRYEGLVGISVDGARVGSSLG